MKVKTKFIVVCSVCLVCFVLCGCNGEQSSHKGQYFVSTLGLNAPEGLDNKQQVIEDALDYVDQHSTEWMKWNIARGKLVAGMNQKEVLASLYATDFRDGVPVTSKTYNSKYGKYETWILGGSSGDEYASLLPPNYALDFTDYILTCIHKPKHFQAHGNIHLAHAE
jgi:hypothetical protein